MPVPVDGHLAARFDYLTEQLRLLGGHRRHRGKSEPGLVLLSHLQYVADYLFEWKSVEPVHPESLGEYLPPPAFPQVLDPGEPFGHSLAYAALGVAACGAGDGVGGGAGGFCCGGCTGFPVIIERALLPRSVS